MNRKITNIIAVFKEQVKIQPDNILLIDKTLKLTYKEVDIMSDNLATEILRFTRDKKARVLLNLNHNYKIIVSIIAILKTGNSYIPTANDISDDRLEYIKKSTDTDLIISEKCKNIIRQNIIFDSKYSSSKLQNKMVIKNYDVNDEVYVLFTSGSTGSPKGVSISYGNLIYILNNMESICPTDNDSTYCFTTPYTFDVSTTEIYGWINGGRIAVANIASYQDFKNFPNYAKEMKITHFAISPSGFVNMLRVYNSVEKDKLVYNLKYLMIAGEAFKKKIFDEWDKKDWKFRLFNFYGPTEATVYALYYELEHGKVYKNNIPIGNTLEGCGYYIDNLIENGIGELVLYGEGIAKKYINNDSETVKKFGFYKGQKSYRTGDLVSKEGNIVIYHGRNDDQIQINGIRVELGEIEYYIRQDERISDVCVATYNDIILAHITLVNAYKEDFTIIKKDLSRRMPKYMVPNYIKAVNELALNENKKADRKVVVNEYLKGKKNTALSNGGDRSVIKYICKIMTNNLEGTLVNCNDDYFELGADSLDVFALVAAIDEKFGIELSIDSIYLYRTPEKLAKYISEKEEEKLVKKSLSEKDHKIDWNDIVILTKEVQNYLYGEHKCLKNRYRTLYLQQMYYYNKFDSFIAFDFDIGLQFTLKEIKEGLIKLVETNPILHSTIVPFNDYLLFEEYELNEYDFIPEIFIDELYVNDLKQFIKSNYATEMFYSRYNAGFTSLFVIVRTVSKYFVIFILDHCVGDASCENLIKNQLINILNNVENCKSKSYKTYCEHVIENISLEKVVNHWYYKNLKKCQINNKNIFIDSLSSESCKIAIRNVPFSNNLKVTLLVSYVISDAVKKITNCDIAVRSLLNMRELEKSQYKDTIGDVHVGISFINKLSMNLREFNQEAEKIVKLLTEEPFHPDQAVNDMFPKYNKDQKEIKNVLINSKVITVNYLGLKSDEELDKIEQTINGIQERLYGIEKQIYVTAYNSKGNIIIFLNKNVYGSRFINMDFKKLS